MRLRYEPDPIAQREREVHAGPIQVRAGTLSIMGLVFGLWFVGFTLSAAVPSASVPMVSAAYAQSAPQGLSKLEDKVNDVATLIRRILYVFAGIGILFVGFRFIQGDPQAWRYAMAVVLGSAIIFAAEEILTWLQS